MTSTEEKKFSCLEKFSASVIGTLEKGFGKLGLVIALHPVRFMVIAVALSAVTGIGLLKFREETEPDKLWTPDGAQVRQNKDWIEANFPSRVMFEKLIATSDNMLKAVQIQALFDLYQESLIIETSSGIKLEDVCLKAGSNCMVFGILEIWSFDNATIRSLDDSQVLTDINNIRISPLYGNEIDLTNYLGYRTYDGNGDIIGAKAALLRWHTEGNSSTLGRTNAWEKKFVSMALRGHSDLSTIYVFGGRSWEDESQKAIESDVLSLSIGYFLVIIFVMLVLGKFNFIEQKAFLTLGGLVCVGLSFLVAMGLSSAADQFYGPVQSVLPFLLLGLGVDDMFVIMGSLGNLSPEEREYDVPEKVSAVLRHAGVSITVTSLTDFVAFMIGATTIIPALRSFCIYAGIGIVALYLLQAIFFTACLSLDLRRVKDKRNACCCMIKHGDDYTPNKCSQKEMIPYIFRKGLAPLTSKLLFKVIILIIAAAVFGVNIYGFVNLEVYFDRNLFLPSDSYAYKFVKAEQKYFPSKGDPGHIYCKTIDYFSHKSELENLDVLMSQSEFIINGTTDSWFTALTGWLSTTSDTDVLAMLDGATKYPTTEANFLNLTYRLTTEEATRTSSYIQFVSSSDLTIVASRFPLVHTLTETVDEEQEVMDAAHAIVKDAGFSSSECFPYSRVYLPWETNRIIQEELYRNIGLAMLCVFLVSLLLIANFITSIFVFLCVIATLINVGGTMYFWGLTIDTVTSIILILSVGLAVDYSAHIGHMFMSVIGSTHDRIKETVGQMGPSVFYGGFSTFLAFVLLVDSNSYIFRTFFKLNFLTVLYGLFHGLIVLPVILSLFGPKPYPNASIVYKNRCKQKKNVESGEGATNPAFDGDDTSKGHAELSVLPSKADEPIKHANGISNHRMDQKPPMQYAITNVVSPLKNQEGNGNVGYMTRITLTDSNQSISPPPSYCSDDHKTNLSMVDP